MTNDIDPIVARVLATVVGRPVPDFAASRGSALSTRHLFPKARQRDTIYSRGKVC